MSSIQRGQWLHRRLQRSARYSAWLLIVCLLLSSAAMPLPQAAAMPVRETTTNHTQTAPSSSASAPSTTSVLQQASLTTTIACPTVGSTGTTIVLPLVLQRASPQTTPRAQAVRASRADPLAAAPPLAPHTIPGFAAATAWLYTGRAPLQRNALPSAISASCAAVLRGKTLARDGTPLTEVGISVLNHAAYGSTASRSDGMFDLAVNGGELLTLRYAKAGYIPVQRQVPVRVQDYTWLPDVVLIPYDANVTKIDLNAPTVQVAQGSPVSDASGARQATLLFQPGTSVTLQLPHGQRRTLAAQSSISVRATEFTVGDRGPQTMPGTLPPQSGYTYAAEFSLDEANAQGANDVVFSKPVIFYEKNFLHFPVGEAVPTGAYDREQAAWKATASGRVIKVLSVTGGLADIDTNGDGQADTAAALAALGITDGERAQLAKLYQPGESLWRVAIPHFSSWDCNWGITFPFNAIVPGGQSISNAPQDKPTCRSGSIIECENQILGEALPVVGTPFQLHYSSERVSGRTVAKQWNIPLSSTDVPTSVKRIDLEVFVAGQRLTQSFAPTPNQHFSFVWEGRDAYGRVLQGRQPVTARVGYVYDGVYQRTSRFGYNGNGAMVTGDRARQELTLWQELHDEVGFWDARAQGLGGWSLDIQHVYDPRGHVLLLGDGQRRSVDSIDPVITTIAGTGRAGFSGDGGPATQAQLSNPRHIALGADGSLFIPDLSNHRVRRIAPDGVISTIAGTSKAGYSGDGGPATSAAINTPMAVAVGAEGSVYIADYGNNVVRRITPDGLIATVAGGGTGGDDGPATQARLAGVWGIAVAPDGTLYLSEQNNPHVRRVTPDGMITSIADANAVGLAVGPDGSVYVAEARTNRVWRINPDGSITLVAGAGQAGYAGDGAAATQALLSSPNQVAVAADGSVYITEYIGQRVRRVDPQGIISTFAGTGRAGASGDGGAAAAAQVYGPGGIAIGADEGVYIADYDGHRIRKVALPLPGFNAGGTLIPSEDGSELYQFDANGRHLQTRDALTGATVYQFGYDASGALASVTDGDSNVTTIARDGAGRPTAITGPDGQRTTLALNGDGFLTAATNPAGETTSFSYTSAGLLTSMTDPRGGASRYTYDDATGRLTHAVNADGGSTTLARTEFNSIQKQPITWTRPPIWTGVQEGPKDASGKLWYDPTYDSSGWMTVTIPEHLYPGNATDRYYRGHLTLSEVTHATIHLVLDDGAFIYVNGIYVDKIGSAWRAPGCFNEHPYCSGSYVPDITIPAGLLHKGDNVIAVDVWNVGIESYSDFQITTGVVGYMVTTTDALGRTNSHLVGTLLGGDQLRQSTAPDGTTTTTLNKRDSSSMAANAQRMTSGTQATADPRWSLLAPQGGQTNTTPGGLTRSTSSASSAALADPNNVLSLTTLTTTATLNQRTATSVYDAATRQFTLTTPGQRQSRTTIDAQGRVTQEAATDLAPASYGYDARGRLISVAQGGGADARTTALTYDAQGYLATISDPLGRKTSFAYDAAGRVTSQTQPDGAVIGYTYDASGNLLSLTPPGKPAHTFAYSPHDMVTTYTPPDVGGGSATAYTYNAAQQLTRIARPDGQNVDFGYDPAGRLSTLTTARGATSYAYDPASGNLATVSAPEGVTLAYEYDGALPTGAVLGGPVAGAVRRSYDNDFRVKATSVNNTLVVNFAYDADSLLTQAGDLRLSYRPQNGLLTGTTLGGVADTMGYNAFAEPASYKATAAAATLYDVQYTRDALGRISAKTETLGGTATTYGYSYDAAGRLSGVAQNGSPLAAYTYDANGNRLTATVGGATTSATYDAQDRLLTYGANSYAYSANGEVQRKTNGAQSTGYAYDAQGNLTAAALPDGTALSYVVDGQNRRIGKRVNGTLVQGFLYEDQLRPIAELNGAGQVVSRFVYATHVNVPDYMIKGGATYRILTDQLGSVRLVVNAATGAVAQRMDYDAWGNVTQDSAPGFQPFGFAGGLYDRDTRLVRFGARDYDAEIGRWTAKDPIGFDGKDSGLYVYSGSDPINFIDPSGLYSICVSFYFFIGGGFCFKNDKCDSSFSAEAGFGYGFSGSFDPFAQTDPGGWYGEVGMSVGIGKVASAGSSTRVDVSGVQLTGDASFATPSGWGVGGKAGAKFNNGSVEFTGERAGGWGASKGAFSHSFQAKASVGYTVRWR